LRPLERNGRINFNGQIIKEEIYGNTRQRKRKRFAEEGSPTYSYGEKKNKGREKEEQTILGRKTAAIKGSIAKKITERP
jgi:hypothetical protein